MMQEDFFIASIIGSLEEVMQYLTSRVSNPALRQGLFFGIILAIILIGFNFISNALGPLGILIEFALYLVFAFLAGQRASQSTGRLTTGVIAGLLTSVVSTLINTIVSAILVASSFNTILQSYKASARSQGQNPNLITPSFLINYLVINILISIVLAILLGLAGGAFGGNIGRRRAQLPPTDGNQEATFEPHEDRTTPAEQTPPRD
jgi:hypothetical protein